MSFLEPYIPNKERLEQRKSDITMSLRTDWVFKVIALLTAVTLYVYVQTERNPTIQRSFNITITPVNNTEGIDYDLESLTTAITLSGQKSVLEGLKDSDIHALADIHKLNPEVYTPQVLLLQIQLPNLPAPTLKGLVFDPPMPSTHVQIYQPAVKTLSVTALYPKEPPVGFRYSNPEIQPSKVRLMGRAEKMKRVTHLVVNAQPSGTGAKVDGEFIVQARDSEDRPVEGVQLEPNAVRVIVPLQEEPPSKIVLVSADISEPTAYPYTISEIRVEPSQLKLLGRPERLTNLSTLSTEPISAKTFTQNQTLTIRLNTPPDIGLRDDQDKPITSVKVTFIIKKMATSEDPHPIKPTPEAGTTPKTAPPNRPLGTP
ncbi:hypothetical protein LBMAG21_04600 [Armatimonadota bacterium]|nr:hypothetical protein LBMAG21_04600 [Armatimonadota bacterium]